MKKEILEQIRRELEVLKLNGRYSKEEILNVFKKYLNNISDEETNHIYMYMGSFKEGKNGKQIFEEKDSSEKDFSCYKNIEMFRETKIRREFSEEFEQNNTILVPEEYSKDYSYEEEYLKKQREFIEKSLQTSQLEAKNYLVKTYSKKS